MFKSTLEKLRITHANNLAQFGEPGCQEQLAEYLARYISETSKCPVVQLTVNATTTDCKKILSDGVAPRPLDPNEDPAAAAAWCGRIWIRFADEDADIDAFGQQHLKSVPVWTNWSYAEFRPGTVAGGYGKYNGLWSPWVHEFALTKNHPLVRAARKESPNCFSWSCLLFKSDWPKIAQAEEREKIVHLLADTTANQRLFTNWEDAQVRAEEDRLLEQVRAAGGTASTHNCWSTVDIAL